MTLPFRLGDVLTLRIEVARGDFAKRDPQGYIEFLSPFPCPFNYGSVIRWGPDPAPLAEDGEGFDAVLLGPRVRRGSERSAELRAVALFVDGGKADHKLVLGGELSPRARYSVERFCSRYARIKRTLGRETRFEGWL